MSQDNAFVLSVYWYVSLCSTSTGERDKLPKQQKLISSFVHNKRGFVSNISSRIYPINVSLTMASIRVLLSSSSLRRCMFSRSCRASLNDWRKVSKIPKNWSGCIFPSSSPKCFRDLVNCTKRFAFSYFHGKGLSIYNQHLKDKHGPWKYICMQKIGHHF